MIEIEVDLRDEIVGIDFDCPAESRGGFFQFTGALQLHAPKIQAARIKLSGHDGISTGFTRDVEFFQPPLAQAAWRVRVGGRDRVFDGGNAWASTRDQKASFPAIRFLSGSGGNKVSPGRIFNL